MGTVFATTVLCASAMDARTFLGLEPTHNPHRWVLPVVPGICAGGNFLFGGCGLAAAIAAMEGTTGRSVVWATAQYLDYARPPEVVDIDVTIAVSGRNSTQARAVGHVADREVFTVNAALGERSDRFDGQWEQMPSVPEAPTARKRTLRMPDVESIMQALGIPAGGNSLDNTLRVAKLVQTEWVLCDVQMHAISHGFGHGLVHLWAEDGTLLATASQSCIVRTWSDEHRKQIDELREAQR